MPTHTTEDVMEGFNSKIEPGMQAMIIGTRLPENSHLIGRIVVVEALTQVGVGIPNQFIDKEFFDEVVSKVEGAVAYMSGLKVRGMETDYMHIAQKYLMPLPPLEEEELQKEKELELA